MKVSVVGDIKMGVCFARLLKRRGFDVVAFYSDSIETSVKYAVAVSCKAYLDLERAVSEKRAYYPRGKTTVCSNGLCVKSRHTSRRAKFSARSPLRKRPTP
ncbi:MAG: hypothetical protein L6V93_02745 [Clostridiales bacterium]|nr:MAG: hypothetical protein L6V93_02745 [Clostridiales bacterium]